MQSRLQPSGVISSCKLSLSEILSEPMQRWPVGAGEGHLNFTSAAKPEDLSLIPGTLLVEEKNWLLWVVLWLLPFDLCTCALLSLYFIYFIYLNFLDWPLSWAGLWTGLRHRWKSKQDSVSSWLTLECHFSNPKSISILQMHFNLQALASCVAMVLEGWVYFYNLERFSHV